MGSGIAQVAAQHAKIPQVILFDKNQSQLDSQKSKLVNSLQKAKEKGSIGEEEINMTLSSIKPTTKLSDLEASDFIIEVKISFLKWFFNCL